jgi:hypothetical protein
MKNTIENIKKMFKDLGVTIEDEVLNSIKKVQEELAKTSLNPEQLTSKTELDIARKKMQTNSSAYALATDTQSKIELAYENQKIADEYNFGKDASQQITYNKETSQWMYGGKALYDSGQSAGNQIREQMALNSLKWSSASSDGKKLLIAENERLANEYNTLYPQNKIYKSPQGYWAYAKDNLKFYANGGYITSPTMGVLAENNPEWILTNPQLKKIIDMPIQEMGKTLTGAGDVVLNIDKMVAIEGDAIESTLPKLQDITKEVTDNIVKTLKKTGFSPKVKVGF